MAQSPEQEQVIKPEWVQLAQERWKHLTPQQIGVGLDLVADVTLSPFQVKILEIRDSGTFLPMMAVCCMSPWSPATPADQAWWLLNRAGFECCEPTIFLIRIDGAEYQVETEPSDWSITGTRTLEVAHKHLLENWHDVPNGGVIDVEYILGETTQPKTTDRHARSI